MSIMCQNDELSSKMSWVGSLLTDSPPVKLHWFFEKSIRTEKKKSVRTEKKIQLVYADFFSVLTECL